MLAQEYLPRNLPLSAQCGAKGTQAPVQGPRCADSSSAGLARALGSPEPSARQSPPPSSPLGSKSLAGVKLCKPSPKKSDPKKVAIRGPLRVSSDSARE